MDRMQCNNFTAGQYLECWDLEIVPLSYRHNTGVNGPEEFELIVQHRGALSSETPIFK